MSRDNGSRRDYFMKLQFFFHRKRLEKCSMEKRQPYQPKPVSVELLIPLEHDRGVRAWFLSIEISRRSRSLIYSRTSANMERSFSQTLISATYID